ncbi:Protein CYPRO4 [Dichanthelium oligosanthes]|uniref:Protein CYPRO4 n=1 Tax=Dichanthelium oligosanthes TaxID=888268 RepID=A0A1E5VSS4_9POAL|nr:Protein CYPRO4 [Dichanthelium oligosanthes]
MGGSHSREDLDLSDSDSEDAESRASDNSSDYGTPPPASASAGGAGAATPASIDVIDRHLRSLRLKYNEPISPNPSPGPAPTANPAALNAVKLYLHIGGSSPSAKWIVSDRLAAASFVRTGDDEEDDAPAAGPWCLVVGSKIRARVGPDLQLKTFPAQRRVDFVADGVWALKFLHADGFGDFCAKYHSCLFENSYGVAATDEGRAKVFGKDFAAWARPEDGDESIWEDATDGFSPGPKGSPMPPRTPILKPLMEDLREFEEPVEEGSGIQSLALGALDNSFLVGDSGIQVVRNFEHGIHGKGMSVKFSGGSTNFSTPKKALLMRAETNMLLMSPATDGKPHAKGVHQLDIETGKVVSEWKFEKDGADINMRDITNDSKGAQLDPSESTFLGLDDNRLCRWDMRDRRGIVQNLASATESPVTENGKQERHLVATVGKYSVVWNFLQVKNSHHECYQYQEGLKSCYCYKVIPKDESIVASRFMHDKYAISDSPEAPLVVATPMKVTSFSISSRH